MNRKIISILTIILALSIVANLTVYAAVELGQQEQEQIVAESAEWIEREDVPQTITFTPNKKDDSNTANKDAASSSEEESKTLTYDTSRNITPGDTVDVYKDENNDEYRFSDGEITGFFNNDTTPWTKKDAEPITEEMAVKIATKHIKENYNIDLSTHELDTSYNNERYDISFITFYGKDNFITGPKISVRVHENGDIIYSNTNARLYKDQNINAFKNITKEELTVYAEKQLNAMLGEHLISFEIRHFSITENNGKSAVSLLVDVERTFKDDPDIWPAGMELFYEIEQ